MRDTEFAIWDPNTVGFYEREFYPLSNFSSFRVVMDGLVYPTSEHAYQAGKYIHASNKDNAVAEKIRLAPSAHEAWALAQANGLGVAAVIKLNVMEKVLRLKLSQHTFVLRKLLQTGERIIVEDSPVDSFWGIGEDKNGRNELGKLWMKLREEVYEKAVDAWIEKQ